MDESFPLALSQGTVLAGQYMIEKVLGQGGFGITYRAVDHVTNQKVAVKEFFPDTLAYREMTTVIAYPGERSENYAYGKENFLQEAKTLAEFIGNENIVRIHSYFEENGTAYFVMDYIEGQSFDEYLKERGGKIGVEEAKKILLPIMDALESVHSKGIVHRDVTPDNIYITDDNQVKLLDFGAARYSLGDKSRSLDVILKHGFAPKEQYTRRGKQGPFTDVYSLAATFYFAITGKRPPDSVERLDEDDLVPPSNLGVQITDYQETALLMAMNVQPADRFQSMSAFKRALLDEKNDFKQINFDAPGSAAAVAQQIFPTTQQISPAAQQVPPAALQEKGLQQSVQPQLTAEKTKTEENKKRNRKIFVTIAIAAAAIVLFVGTGVVIGGMLSDSRAASSLTDRDREGSGDDRDGDEDSRDRSPEDEAPWNVSLGEENPGEENPGEENSGEENPGEENPGEENPGEENPGEENPGDENPEESTAYQKEELLVVGNTPANIKNLGVYTKSGDKVFLIDDNYHSVYSTDGYVFQDLSGTFRCLSYYDGTLYYLYDKSAYSKNMTTDEQEIMIPELAAYAGNIERLYVTTGCYFLAMTDDFVYRVSRKTGELEDKIYVTGASYNFTLADGWLYYIGTGSDGYWSIFRIKADDFSVADNRIYSENGRYSEPVIEGDYIYVQWTKNDGTAVYIARYKRTLDDVNADFCYWDVSDIVDPTYYLEYNVADENIFFKSVVCDETGTVQNTTIYRIIAGSGYGSEYECVVLDTRNAKNVNVGENVVFYMAYSEEDGKTMNFYQEF